MDSSATQGDLQLVSFDLETTGLSPKTDRIIEIGATRFNSAGAVIAEFEILVDPGMHVPLAVQRLTGITDADLDGQVVPVEAVAQLADFARGAILVAHGALFDMAHCRVIAPDSFAEDRLVLDTLELARVVVPTAASHSLPLLCKAKGLQHTRPHRALPDADATRLLLGYLQSQAENLPPESLHTIRQLAHSSSSLELFFTQLVGGEGKKPERGMPMTLQQKDVSSVPPTVRTTELSEATTQLLGPDGPLAAANLNYEYRESQIEMARAVAQTLDRSRTLMVEAGTGVGKSLAYLTPLMLWAQRTGQRGVVATQTITLQEQLGERDALVVNTALAEPVSVALLKGRSHYVSLRRWERFRSNLLSQVAPTSSGTPDPEAIRFALKMEVWLSSTTTGDRGELRMGALEEPFWEQVQSDTDDCLGSACANWRSGGCFMVAARRRANSASVVITNHALLLADSERQGQVLSDYQALVIDEAHRLEESATSQLGRRVHGDDIDSVLQRAADLSSSDPSLDEQVSTAHEASKRLFGEIKGLVGVLSGADGSANAVVGLSSSFREEAQFHSLGRTAQQLIAALYRLSQTVREGDGDQLLVTPSSDSSERTLIGVTLDELALAIESIMLRPRSGYVCWLEVRAEHAEIHEAPLDVAAELRRGILAKPDAVVLTSATLQVGGRFDFMRSRLGVGEGADLLALPSPFDYLSQALCLVCTDIPPYDAPTYDDVLARVVGQIAERLDGRTLGLFTGYGALRRVAALLERKLEAGGMAVLAQGIDGTRRQILDSFVHNERSVLCGTSTFWEGIDLPGDDLRCVVIAKLPFPVPTDPLVKARCEMLRDPFRDYILPTAIIRLRQGFGRLIRHGTDRGAVVLADSRLTNRDYAHQFLAALPPAAIATVPCDEVADRIAAFVVSGEIPALAEALVSGGQSDDWADEGPQSSHPHEDPA